MGRRARRRGQGAELDATGSAYSSPDHGELVLRGAMSAKTRTQYAQIADPSNASAAAGTEDVWARAVEFLFERLAVRWTVQEVVWEGQKELLARYRAADAGERLWIRSALREHVGEHFPELQAP